MGARIAKGPIMEERPLRRVQSQWRLGVGEHWEAPVPGTFDQPNQPVRQTRVHAHRLRASAAFDTSRLPSRVGRLL